MKFTPKQATERASAERPDRIEAAGFELTRKRQIKDFYTAEEFGRRR
jgi:hypothetical protein